MKKLYLIFIRILHKQINNSKHFASHTVKMKKKNKSTIISIFNQIWNFQEATISKNLKITNLKTFNKIKFFNKEVFISKKKIKNV
jgi:hypothetical protein